MRVFIKFSPIYTNSYISLNGSFFGYLNQLTFIEEFRLAAEQNTDSRTLREKLKLTRKQRYASLSGLVEAGLVKRKINTRQYFVTTLGRIVYDSISRIEIAYNNHIPLKAIDSINMSDELPKKERSEIINELIKNEEIRRIYLQARPYFANQE